MDEPVPPIASEAPRLTAPDVDFAYRLILGRPAEPGAGESRIGGDIGELLRDLIASEEFDLRLRGPLMGGIAGALPSGSETDVGDLVAWALRSVRLSRSTRTSLKAARDWRSLLCAVLADPFIRDLLRSEPRFPALEQLARALGPGAHTGERVEVVGAIEHADVRSVRGWALNRSEPGEALTVEIHADGRFLAAGRTGVFRRDIQEVHGGEGAYGFDIALELSVEGRNIELSVRESRSGTPIGFATVRDDAARSRVDQLMLLNQELAAVKRSLARIEALLPEARRIASFSLASYDEYWRLFYGGMRPGAAAETPAAAEPLSLVLAASGDAGRLDRTLASVLAQSHGEWDLTVVAEDSRMTPELETAFEQQRRKSRRRLGLTVARAGLSEARNAAARVAGSRYLVFVGEGVLAPDALMEIVRAARAQPALIYADGDALTGGEDEEVHSAPRLRPQFDHDLMLQEPWLGDLIAVRADIFAQAGGFRARFEPVEEHDLWMSIAQLVSPIEIAHIPRVLHHAFGPVSELPTRETERALRECVEAHLAQIGRAGRVEPHQDILGPPRPGAVRIRPAGLAGVRARVIIPTRDRFDLVEACLAGLEMTRGANVAAFDVVVIDNDSNATIARAAFSALRERFDFTLSACPGPFNWAAINNAGVGGSDCAVLVFLNNDTVAVSPDWCDCLCALALREDVGAVGARLLYPDGSVQHAGMVLAGAGLPVHEGVGAPGREGGYLGRHTLTRQCVAVTGACMATSTAVFGRSSGFDAEGFAVAFSDVDYCLRVRAAGLKVLYTPDATFYHLESGSRGLDTTPQKAGLFAREAAAFRAKWAGALDRDPFYNPHFERFAAPFSRLGPPPAL